MACQFHRVPALTLCTVVVAITGYSVAWPGTVSGQGAPHEVRSSNPREPEDNDRIEHQTLEAALFLAGRYIAKLPIVLVSVIPDTASRGVQGWTSHDAAGNGDRIFLYTRSRTFRCARPSNGNYQCVLRLASVLVHEASHFSHGANEADAYAAQITFLLGHQAELDQIADVRASRDHVVAVAREALEAAKTRYRNRPR